MVLAVYIIWYIFYIDLLFTLMGGCLSIKCQDDEDKAGSPSPKKKHISGCNTFLSLFFWNGEKITTNTKRLLHYNYLIETLIYYITRKLTNIIIINNKTICDTCSPSSLPTPPTLSGCRKHPQRVCWGRTGVVTRIGFPWGLFLRLLDV